MAVFQSRNAKLGGGIVAAVIAAIIGYFLIDRPADVSRVFGTPDSNMSGSVAAPPTTDAVPAQDAAVVPDAPAEETTAAVEAPKSDAPDSAPTVDAATADAPRFDEVRRDPDGMTVIAGRAAPGSSVKVLSNGKEIGSATADSAGKFATLAILPPDGKGQVLSLEAQTNETTVASADEVILAPLSAPTPALAPSPDTAKAPAEAASEIAAAAPSDVPASTSQDSASVDQQPAPAAPTAEAPTKPIMTEAPAQPAQQVAVLASTEQGVELLPGSVPARTDKISLDTITYSETGEVRLAGRAQSEASSVQVYLNNAPVGNLKVDQENRWRGDIEDIAAGIYTLRVDELNAAGKVISRVETPFKRESAETLASATANYDGPIKAVTVQEGATLWAIARDRYGDPTLYVRVFEANRNSIRDPDLIYPGQVFSLPD